MSQRNDLEGKVVLVTGGAQGLGEAIGHELVARGADVVITDVNREVGEAAAAAMKSGSAFATFLEHDVSDERQWENVVTSTLVRYGRIDVLVNNAGLIQFAPIEEMDVDQFDRVIRVNVRGTFLGCKAILPAMRAAGGGSIINMSSMNGIVSNSPGQSAYATSKGAVRMLTKAVAQDYAQYGIRVNSVHPGTIASTFVKPFLEDPESRAKLLGHTTMNRPGESSEVATAVAFLASNDSSYMTGSELVVDGGFTAS